MKATKRTVLQLVIMLCVLCIASPAIADVFVIPSGVRIIEEEAFSGTSAGTLVIPTSTTSIESKAFASCDELTDVYLPDTPVTIASDAFDHPSNLTFHVYMGSANANWALDHGYPVAYMTADDLDYGGWSKVESLIETSATSASSSAPYGTHRLIVRLHTGYSMPDVNAFRIEDGGELEAPPTIVPLDNNLYIVQFSNPNSARNCAETLKWWTGCKYVEADYFLSANGGVQRRRAYTGDPMETMGFGLYTSYLGKQIADDANVTIAIIDTGVNFDQLSGRCKYNTEKNYDYVNSRNASNGFIDNHGTDVATRICDAFGELGKDHLTIISYRVVRATDSTADYLLIGRAIERAKQDGASFICIPQAFNSAYIKDKENYYVKNAVSFFGSGIFAAAGNTATLSAQNVFPANVQGCNSVTGAVLDANNNLMRASTASGANYAGFDPTSSYATAYVVAAAALCRLDSDPQHTLDKACVTITDECGYGMPDLSTYAVTPVSQIILNNGDPIESILEIGDKASIDYEVLPDDATVSTVTVTSSDSNIIEVLYNTGVRVRISAKAKGTANLTFTADDGNVAPIIVPITVVKPVISVTITGDTGETLMKGETLPLTATVLPEDATDTSVTWTSSNDAIATVSETGVVTQIGAGEVTITATSNYDSRISDSVNLNVSDIPGDLVVTVTAPKASTGIGRNAESIQMSATVTDAAGTTDGIDQRVAWNVDKPEIATISENGTLTAVRAGDVIVTATSVIGNNNTGYMGITVIQLPTDVTVSGPDTVNVGETIQLVATVGPDNARDKTVVWSSSKTAIATVDENTGLVTGVAKGNAVIVAKCNADNTVMDYYAISVTVLPDDIIIDPPSSTTLDIDETLALSATVSPSDASDKTVTWSTNDSAIATVSSGGVVTAKAPGSVQITASTINGKTDSILLTVRQPYTLSFNANGGTCGTSSWTCYSGDAIEGTLPSATRTGYTFNGWYTAASGGSPVTAATSFTSSSSVTIYAHWIANHYTVNFNGNGGSASTSTKTVTYDSTYGTLASATLTGHTLTGWYTAASGGTQIAESTKVTITDTQTLYAHWKANDYSYNIVYKSSNGTSLGSSSETKTFGTTNTVTPPAKPGYTTPAAQSVAWDATSKTITFTYGIESVTNATTSGTFTTSPEITYSTKTEYQNRTATSVDIRVTWTLTLHGKGKTVMQNAIHFWGKCGSVSIPNTKITSWNEWQGPYAAGVNKTKSATSAWVTIPLTTTNQTTLSLSMELWQCNANGTKLTSNTHKTGLPLTVNIPAY